VKALALRVLLPAPPVRVACSMEVRLKVPPEETVSAAWSG